MYECLPVFASLGLGAVQFVSYRKLIESAKNIDTFLVVGGFTPTWQPLLQLTDQRAYGPRFL